MSDNREYLEQTIGNSPVHAFANKVKFHLIAIIFTRLLKASYGCVL